MFHPKEILESQVIKDYLNGKTRNQIAKDNNTSTGNVSNITNEWMRRIGRSDGEEIRDFVKLVRKAGLSVKQCADGYRTTQLMKKTGILSDDEIYQDNNEEFTAFVKEIYLNCRDAGIDPPILVGWMQDLFECFSISMGNNNNYNRSFSFATNCDNEEDDEYNEDAQSDIPKHQQLRLGFEDSSEVLHPNEPTLAKNPNYISDTDSFNRESSGDSLNPNPYSANRAKIPFVSQVSNFIAQRKKECSEIKNYKSNLEDETKRLERQINQMNDNLGKTIKKERHVMHYLVWFYKLKQELWNRYSIRVEEIPRFAKVINDFKNHDYDPYEIIREYSNLESVRQEITAKKNEVEYLEQMVRWLNGNIVSKEARLSIRKQSMDAFDQLNAMGFGLPELKQIYDVILEISSQKNTTTSEATGIFIKDIEKNYYDNVLYGDKVKEKKSELEKIRNEFPNHRHNLQTDSFVGPTLSHLLQNGVTKEDIININQLYTDFANNRFFLDSSESEKYTTDKGKTKPRDRIKDCKTFTDKLRKLGDINSAIKKQKVKLTEMEKQVSDVKRQKQEIDASHRTTDSISSYNDAQIFYLNGFLNHVFKHIEQRLRNPLGFTR